MEDRRRGLTVNELVLAGFFAAVTSVLAYIKIPIPIGPVPISGQTLGVMLSGGLGGPVTGAAAQAVYVLLGLVGIPVFAGGTSGPGVLLGPTGGYLWSFVPGAYVIGFLLKRHGKVGSPEAKYRYLKAFTACMIGGVGIVYVCGVSQLALVAHLGIVRAVVVGALPFLAGDVMKALIAAFVISRFPRNF
ncbi:MAG TPA: biotin transporter BioY [Clostridia bacterium]|nr:biotin transporter BioY [Clostridia bacterium]